MSDPALLKAEIDFGVEVQQFLESDIGRYLLGRAKQEIDCAVGELKKVNPYIGGDVEQLQTIIKRNESILLWLEEAIDAGYEARAQVEDGY